MDTPTASTYQFGPFEVNVVSGELLKQGRRVKLQDQPFRLLVILLENGGHVVSGKKSGSASGRRTRLATLMAVFELPFATEKRARR